MIRILEKLAPNQPLFSNNDTFKMTVSNPIAQSKDIARPLANVSTNSKQLPDDNGMTENNTKSSEFPFLSWNTSILMQNETRHFDCDT